MWKEPGERDIGFAQAVIERRIKLNDTACLKIETNAGPGRFVRDEMMRMIMGYSRDCIAPTKSVLSVFFCLVWGSMILGLA